MFDGLYDLVTASPMTYAVVGVVILVEAVFPVLPSETLLVIGGVIAARGDLAVVPLVVVGWIAATAGDNLTYTVGSRPGRRLKDRLVKGKRGARAVRWAEKNLAERTYVLSVVRFIPVLREATTFTAGTLRMSRWRFTAFVTLGAALWSTIHVALGYLGGKAFQDSFLVSTLLSFGAAGLLALGGEVMHRRQVAGEADD